MQNIEARLTQIETDFLAQDRPTLITYLEELNAFESDAELDLDGFYRLEAMRLRINTLLNGQLRQEQQQTPDPEARGTAKREIERVATPLAEAFNFLRTLIRSRGEQIEKAVALLKLEAIRTNSDMAEPAYVEVFPNENLPIWLNGYFTDHQNFFEDNPRLKEIVEQFAEKKLAEIRANYEKTLAEYKALPFNPEIVNLSTMATDRSELSILKEAAQLLGYRIEEGDASISINLKQRSETRGNLDEAINTRITVGLYNLLKDIEAEHIRRPVMRFMVVMANHMANELRG